MKNSLRALGHRAYLLVWVGSLLSNIGNWMENVGQGWVVASQTHSPFMVEMLSFAQFLPVIFLTLPAGIIADRFNRKYVLLIAQVSMCLIASSLAILAHHGLATPQVVIFIGLLEGIAWALNGPAWQTVLPYLVPRRDLESAIALNSIQYNLARLIGPAFAGYVVARIGFAYAFDINAMSFLAVILAIVFVRFEKHSAATTAPVADGKMSLGFRDAWHWTWKHPGPTRLVLSIGVFAIFAAPIQGLMPFVASDVLNIGPKGLGILLACLGGGAITGAFLLGALPAFYPRHHLIPLSLVFLGIFAILYSEARTALSAYPMLFMAGIFWLWTMVSCNTAMQLLVPDKIRGRAMSILLLAHVGMLPVGHILGAVLSQSVGPRYTLTITSCVLILFGIITLINRVPEIDGFTPNASRRKRNFFSEVILATSHRAEALSLDRSGEEE